MHNHLAELQRPQAGKSTTMMLLIAQSRFWYEIKFLQQNHSTQTLFCKNQYSDSFSTQIRSLACLIWCTLYQKPWNVNWRWLLHHYGNYLHDAIIQGEGEGCVCTQRRLYCNHHYCRSESRDRHISASL